MSLFQRPHVGATQEGADLPFDDELADLESWADLHEPLLVVDDLMRLLRVSRATVYAWAKQKKIPCVRANGVLRFSPEMVRVWLREQAGLEPAEEMQNDSQEDPRSVVRRRLDRRARPRQAAVPAPLALHC